MLRRVCLFQQDPKTPGNWFHFILQLSEDFWLLLHGFQSTGISIMDSPLFGQVYAPLFSIIASAVRVSGGSLADRLGGEKTSLISVFLVLIASTLMIFAHNYRIALTAVILLAIGMGVNNAAVFKLVPRYIPKAIGGAAGWIGGIGAFGGFVIPPLMGEIVSRYGQPGYSLGFIIFILLSIMSIIIGYGLLKSKNRV